MTDLSFKGKEFVYNHHLAVPFRPLVPHPRKGIGPVALDGNLVIQGDNLHALKALLPLYAGKVDCIFIDPPYNTGNEGWCYNDNVNSPMIREWLESNPIGIEDGLRHDKWCAMMWPRLRLLHELLAEDGSLWMTLDDNEAQRGKLMLDEIFGDNCFVTNIVWQARYSVSNDTDVSRSHNHILVYSKQKETWKKLRNELPRDETQTKQYSNNDNDPNGPWRAVPWDAPNIRENLSYPITTPSGAVRYPPPGRCWAREEDKWKEIVAAGLDYYGKNGDGAPSYKRYLKDAGTVVPTTWWPHGNSGHTDEASKELAAFNLDVPFQTPKPLRLLEKILAIATRPDSLVLDSFAGSGTTAHATLSLNQRDGGNRQFILVQLDEEDGKANADNLTAERVRRVINGYEFQGTQKAELLRERLTWRSISNSSDLVHKVEAIETLCGHEYDRIKKEVKDGELILTGEKSVSRRVEGIAGTFTYCTLGDPVELDKILSGKTLPDYSGLGSALFHMATSQALIPSTTRKDDFYLGETEGQHVWLIYKPDIDWLKSPEAALTLARAKAFASSDPGKRHLVFAPARFVSQKMLAEQNIPVDFVPLPFALYRIDRS
ncbi:TPA: site-specific DNA-methyltransferase [Stenotrophomonas maltophilia]|nr:site-specific DNA-methyltransferase [Stenotrophomonas maltophilia]